MNLLSPNCISIHTRPTSLKDQMDFSTVIEDPKVFAHSDFTYSVKKISQNDLTTEKET